MEEEEEEEEAEGEISVEASYLRLWNTPVTSTGAAGTGTFS